MGKIKISLLIIIVVVIILVIAAVILMLNGQLINTGLKNVEITEEIYSFPAEIKGIKDETITLLASIPLFDSSNPPVKATVKITIDDQTKIAKLIFPAEIKDKTKPIYPEEILLTLNDLKIGNIVDVSSKINVYDNLKNNTAFVAAEIFIIEK